MKKAILFVRRGCRRDARRRSASTSTPIAGQGGTGTIVGHVKYMGPTPVNPLIRMGADPRCNKLYVGKRPTAPTFVVGADGAFANVLVNLDGSFPNAAVPTTPVVLNQKDCMYVPRVLGARIGQTLQVTNEDPTDHNVHSLSKAGNDFNRTQLINGKPFDVTLKVSELLRITCDNHTWMTAVYRPSSTTRISRSAGPTARSRSPTCRRASRR